MAAAGHLILPRVNFIFHSWYQWLIHWRVKILSKLAPLCPLMSNKQTTNYYILYARILGRCNYSIYLTCTFNNTTLNKLHDN